MSGMRERELDPGVKSYDEAFVKPAPGYAPSGEPAREIQQFVKDHPARHEVPREIEFLEDFPLTTTGKVMRNELRLRGLERKDPV